MRRSKLRPVLAAVLLVILVVAGWHSRTRACGPFFRRAVFVLREHPDFPLEAFAAGNLGIVAPTWARSQLFVAYRYLAAQPLTPGERGAVLALWDARLRREPPGTEAPGSWLKARAAVPGAAPLESFGVFRYVPDTYDHYLNCPEDAFATASRTLAARIEQFGARSEAVAEWLRAQDQVFANCPTPSDAGRTAAPALPEPAPPSLPPVIRADRDYQVASAQFYAGRFEEAARGFAAIAADPGSPWRPLGRYLEARALVRQGTVRGDRASLSRAEALLRQLADDPEQTQLRPAIRRLLGFVRVRTAPLERMRELASSVARSSSGADLKQELWDYTVLLDGLLAPVDTARERAAAGASSAPPRAPLSPDADDLSDWILTVQGYGPAPHALDRWHETRSPAWLVAAIALADPGHTTPGLIAAARELAPESPAFPTVMYHAARLLIETGQADEARVVLDGLLPRARAEWPRSSLNAVLAQRAVLARGLDEFASFSLRPPSLFTFDLDGRELPEEDEFANPEAASEGPAGTARAAALLADDAAATINELLPVAQAAELTGSKSLPGEWQHAVARAAWVRAVLLDAEAPGSRAARLVSRDRATPEASRLAALVQPYLAATSATDRRFAAVFALLRNPGLGPYVRGGAQRPARLDRIDNYRDNWWCAPPADEPPATADGLFPPREQRARAAAERARLREAGPAPNYLARQVLGYARGHPGDPRVPEALALAVKATRFGCVDAETTKWSREAFTLLHQKYGGTSWAKATRYYY